MLFKSTKESRREQLLQCATKVFSEQGYHTASVADIIAAADVARGTFYLYFESKRQVFDEILDDLLADIGCCIKVIEVSPTAPPPLEQLKANLERVFSLLLGNRDLVMILLCKAQGVDSECQQKLDRFYQIILSQIESALRTGMMMGLVRPCEPRVNAAAVMGAIQGIIAQATRQESPPEITTIADQTLAFGLHGLLKLPPNN